MLLIHEIMYFVGMYDVSKEYTTSIIRVKFNLGKWIIPTYQTTRHHKSEHNINLVSITEMRVRVSGRCIGFKCNYRKVRAADESRV